MSGELFDEQYELIGEGRKGGMSVVYQAREVTLGRIVAIKICKESTDRWLRDSFEAEHKALANLSHPNIVKAFHIGACADRTLYLVLEWVPGTLHEHLLAQGPMNWSHYFVDLGKPLLDALRYAHGRKVAHRDLKPKNILMTSDAIPKIADFGIARMMDKVPVGPTLRGAGSAPYTPPEPDDSIRSLGRDCWSWAAVTLSCLTGRIFSNLAELYAALEKSDVKSVPIEEMRRALALDPKARYVSASELFVDIEAFERRRLQAQGQAVQVAVTFTRSSLERCLSVWGVSDIDVVRGRILSDLNEVSSIDLVSQDPVRLTIVGATCVADCEVQSAPADQILVSRVEVLSLSSAERRRDDCASVPFVHFVDRVNNPEELRRNLRRVVIYIEGELSRKEEERIRAEKERFFDGLAGYLRERERHYRDKNEAIHYSRLRRSDDRWVAVLEREVDANGWSDSVVVELPNSRPVIFDVIDVNLDQIVMRHRYGAIDLVPESGYIKINRTADLLALGKQRTALELVRNGRAVSAQLGDLLRDPSTATAPEASGIPKIEGLSPDKHRVLEKALGIVQFLIVEGPPGTGKTTLIAELIAQYLSRFPDSRVLLSSQTHVALDHVITKLKQKGLEKDIVRIARGQEGKVDPQAASLLLGRKVEEWARRVESRSRDFIDVFARRYSLDSTEFRVGILGNERLRRIARIKQIDVDIEVLRLQHADVETERKRRVEQAESVDLDEMITATSTLIDQLANLERERDQHIQADKRVCNLLSSLGGHGKAIAEAEESSIPEKVKVLLQDTKEAHHLRAAIELQHKWLERLGASQDFFPAVLKEARVVCGTCVGLAGIQAIYDDEYDLCIVDEASKATATETIIPMSRGRAWMLVGDPKQLPPYLDSGNEIHVEGFRDEEVNRTLLDYMLSKLPVHSKESLSEQHRMVSGIGSLVSRVFYSNTLKSTRGDSERAAAVKKVFSMPVTWVSTSKVRAYDHRMPTGSYRNAVEAEIVATLIRELNSANRSGKRKISVAVIASYTAQVKLLKETLGAIAGGVPHLNFECNTVDAFQGRDADVCFYSVTRSNREYKLGFQTQKPRLNVALSRARDALVIVGDWTFCRACPGENPFPQVMEYIEENSTTCEIREHGRR